MIAELEGQVRRVLATSMLISWCLDQGCASARIDKHPDGVERVADARFKKTERVKFACK